MIKPSPELLAVSRRWYKAIVVRKHSELENFLSSTEHLRFVGSAEGESWSGQSVRRAIGAHFDEVPAVIEKEELEAEAFEQGETGWSCFSHMFRFANRPDVTVVFRTTLIFSLENGSWKIVQRHASVPTPNMEITGHEHNAIRNLVDAAQQGFSLTQSEGLASVMFTDLVGSSTLASALGDQVWTPIITAHFAMIRRHVEAYDGQFVKSLGDGTMSSFSSARSALAAARDIQTSLDADTSEPRLGLRIGLHTGDVVQSDDDFFGTVVNTAARITAAAGPGEVCISNVTRMMVGTDESLSFSEAITVHLKGITGEQTLYRLTWKP
ncbi:MAG: adenylate/guanylate cyclase domain-containing protein [Tateyamaria sp.]